MYIHGHKIRFSVEEGLSAGKQEGWRWQGAENAYPRWRYVSPSTALRLHSDKAGEILFILAEICLHLHSPLHPSTLSDKFYLSVQCCVTPGSPTLTHPCVDAGGSQNHYSRSQTACFHPVGIHYILPRTQRAGLLNAAVGTIASTFR